MRHPPHRARPVLATVSSLVLLAGLAAPALAVPTPGTDVLYTLDADFDRGAMQDVNHDAPGNN